MSGRFKIAFRSGTSIALRASLERRTQIVRQLGTDRLVELNAMGRLGGAQKVERWRAGSGTPAPCDELGSGSV